MNKLLIIITLLSCTSTFSYSQSKTEFGIATEGSWLTPRPNNKYSEPNRNGVGAGIGIYTSLNLFCRFSADAGLLYQCKQMQQHYTIPKSGNDYSENYNGYGYGNENQSQEEGWAKYNLSYIVFPFHLQLLYSKYAFIRGGIEASWLTNYNPGSEKTEYNWTVGIGSQRYKLKWSINFIRGFKKVGFLNGIYEIENGKYKSGTIYKNQMLQLNLSYPIWQKK